MCVVLDTCVTIRALGNAGKYRELRESIVKKCDKIAFSKEIRKEWIGQTAKAGMSPSFLIAQLEKLESVGKLKFIGKSKLQLVELNRRPTDKYDEKFLTIALATKAKCIITTDPHLLELDPYKWNGTDMRIFRPEDYRNLNH